MHAELEDLDVVARADTWLSLCHAVDLRTGNEGGPAGLAVTGSCNRAVSAVLPVRWLTIFASLALCAVVPVGLADWPCYRADTARSGRSSAPLSALMSEVWCYTAAQPPRPAWPELGNELHRLDFDYAFQVAATGDLVCFGSSADDSVRAPGGVGDGTDGTVIFLTVIPTRGTLFMLR